jgi:N-acetyl-anhydromuramyl-L-alanine amidase AmpD
VAGLSFGPVLTLVSRVFIFNPPNPEAPAPATDAQRVLAEYGADTAVRITDSAAGDVVNAFRRRSRDVGYPGETADGVAGAQRLVE